LWYDRIYIYNVYYHHHCQPSLFHCWTKASLLLDHKSLYSTIPPSCYHYALLSLLSSLFLVCPFFFYLWGSISLCPMPGCLWLLLHGLPNSILMFLAFVERLVNLFFCFIVVLLVLSSHVIPNIFRSTLC